MLLEPGHVSSSAIPAIRTDAPPSYPSAIADGAADRLPSVMRIAALRSLGAIGHAARGVTLAWQLAVGRAGSAQ